MLVLRGYSGVRYVAVFFFQAEDGIRDLVRSRGLGDVYKRQATERVLDADIIALADLEETERQDLKDLGDILV